ncbi:MAG: hypothetical protein AAGD28_07000 [Bacteroidota bacterium]
MKNLLSIILAFFLYSSVHAQFLTPQTYSALSTRLLYLEFMGNGGNYSLNYEQLIALSDHAAASTRFGVSAFPSGDQQMEFGIPVTVSGFFGGGNLYGEIGAGVNVEFNNRLLESGADITPTGILGLRFHPDYDGGILIRLSYTPFWRNNTLEHGIGFSIGFGLKS